MAIEDPALSKLAERFRSRRKFETEQTALLGTSMVPGLGALAALVRETPRDRRLQEASDAELAGSLRVKGAELAAKIQMAKDAQGNDRFLKLAEIRQDLAKEITEIVKQKLASSASVSSAKAAAVNGMFGDAQKATAEAAKIGGTSNPLSQEKVAEARALGEAHQATYPESSVLDFTSGGPVSGLVAALRGLDAGSRYEYLQEYLKNSPYQMTPAEFINYAKNDPSIASQTNGDASELIKELELASSQGSLEREDALKRADVKLERGMYELKKLGLPGIADLEKLAAAARRMLAPDADDAAIETAARALDEAAKPRLNEDGEPIPGNAAEQYIDDLASSEPVDPTSRQIKAEVLKSAEFAKFMENRGFAPGSENDAFRSMMQEHRKFIRAQRQGRSVGDADLPTQPGSNRTLPVPTTTAPPPSPGGAPRALSGPSGPASDESIQASMRAQLRQLQAGEEKMAPTISGLPEKAYTDSVGPTPKPEDFGVESDEEMASAADRKYGRENWREILAKSNMEDARRRAVDEALLK
jgi:hypothetical protein